MEVAKLVALTPFIADEIYESLSGDEPSVHLCDYPEPDPALRDEDLEWQMRVARDAVEPGRAARAQAKVKLRQPSSSTWSWLPSTNVRRSSGSSRSCSAS